MMWFILFLSAICLGGCYDTSESPRSSGKSVTVAVVATLQGENSTFGRQGMEGFKAALRSFPRLSNGDAVRVEFVDDNVSTMTPPDEVAKVKAIGARALVSIQDSDATLRLGSVVTQGGIPTLAVTATHEDVASFAYVTQVSMSNETEGTVAAFYSRDEMLLDRVGIVYDGQNAFSKSLASQFKKVFESLGGSVTVYASLESTSVSEALRIMQQSKAQLIYAPVYSENILPLIRAWNEQKWHVELMGADGLLADVLLKQPADIAMLDGTIVVEHFADMMPTTRIAGIASQQFARDDLKATTVRYLGFEAYLLLRSALEACADYQPECINQHLRNSTTLEGMGGIFRVLEGRAERPVFINRIQDGILQMLVKIY